MLPPLPGTYLLTLFGGSEGLCCMQSSCYLCLCSNNVENCRSKILQFSINHHDAFAQYTTIQVLLKLYCIFEILLHIVYKHVTEIHGECHYSLVKRFVRNYIHKFGLEIDPNNIECIIRLQSSQSNRYFTHHLSSPCFHNLFERKSRAYWKLLVY